MYELTPITPTQIGMVKRILVERRREMRNGFETRDLVLIYRMKGRNLAKDLPGIGRECKWLDRRTDEDSGPYTP
jgi:hypothetical protein